MKDPNRRADATTLLEHPFLKPDVDFLLANPSLGLSPIRDLVSSALEALAKYRQSTIPAPPPSFPPSLPLEEQFGKTGALELMEGVEEGREGGMEGGGEERTMRPVSLSTVSATSSQGGGREGGREGGEDTLLRGPSQGRRLSHSGSSMVRSGGKGGREGGREGGHGPQWQRESGKGHHLDTLVRPPVARVGGKEGEEGCPLRLWEQQVQEQQQQQQRWRQEGARSSADVSHAGTMVRHRLRPISGSCGGDGAAGAGAAGGVGGMGVRKSSVCGAGEGGSEVLKEDGTLRIRSGADSTPRGGGGGGGGGGEKEGEGGKVDGRVIRAYNLRGGIYGDCQ